MLIQQAKEAGTPIISAMGAGNKMDPTAFEVADISETSVCPLAKVMRRELKKRGITNLKVVFSKEPPVVPRALEEKEEENGFLELEDRKFQEAFDSRRQRQVPGSNAYVPSSAGLAIAAEVIRELTEGK